MKIVEVRDGFVKIESVKKLEISSFIELKGLEKRFVAQIVRSKNNGTGYILYAKILFINDGSLKKYDKTMPDSTAEVSEFPFETVNNLFNYTNPIVAGKFISDRSDILLDSESFNNLTLASIDNPEMNNIIVQNLAKQFKQMGKTVIIDMLGVINGDKYIAGRDFKLPLNTDSLKFLYEDCLSDATAESKDLIKEIFTDLSEYAKTVRFLPFSALKLIIDDMVEKSHIFKLLVFKNKLAKFDTAGYFASNQNDAENLKKILKSDLAIIDLSKLDNMFQNRYLEVILSEISSLNDNTSIIVEASNAITKSNIKSLINPEKTNLTFVTHSRFKYLSDLKNIFKNFIIENTYANRNIFDLYSFFLEAISTQNYLIVGASTNYVPLVSNLEKYDVAIKKLPKDSLSNEIIGTSYDSQVTDEQTESSTDNISSEVNIEIEENQNIMQSEIMSSIFESDDNEESEDEQSTTNQTATAEQEPEIELEAKTEINIEEEEEEEEKKDEDEDDDEIINDNNNIEVLPDTEEPIRLEESYNNKPLEQLKDTEEPIEIISDEEKINTDFSIVNDTDEFMELPLATEDINEIHQENVDEIETGSVEEIKMEDDIEINISPIVIPLENQEPELEDFSELDSENIDENDILVDLNEEDDEDDNQLLTTELEELEDSESMMDIDELDKNIVEDVDKVFTTMKDESISDSDLDFIDSLNDNDDMDMDSDSEDEEFFSPDDSETLQELEEEDEEDDEGFLEPLEEISDSAKSEPEKEILQKREASTPMVPIYDAEIPDEDKVVSDDIEQGDSVVHAKYGSGVVEKMIRYGNKNLYSINFDNVGRRLLDPTLTEIRKA